MAYLKPAALTRHLANPLAMRLGARGVATLTVAGRRTGEPHKVPVTSLPDLRDHPVFRVAP